MVGHPAGFVFFDVIESEPLRERPEIRGDAAALLSYQTNATAEGTVTASSSVFYLGLNQRASQRWIARDEKSALIVAAVSQKGWAMRAKSPNYASTVGWQFYISE